MIEFEWESISSKILGKDWKVEHELWFKYELQIKQKEEEIEVLNAKNERLKEWIEDLEEKYEKEFSSSNDEWV